MTAPGVRSVSDPGAKMEIARATISICAGQSGGRGIRTHVRIAPEAVFKTAALGHYASPPCANFAAFSEISGPLCHAYVAR